MGSWSIYYIGTVIGRGCFYEWVGRLEGDERPPIMGFGVDIRQALLADA